MQKVETKLIDTKAAKEQRNKIIADRGDSNNDLIQSLKENAKNKNTERSKDN